VAVGADGVVGGFDPGETGEREDLEVFGQCAMERALAAEEVNVVAGVVGGRGLGCLGSGIGCCRMRRWRFRRAGCVKKRHIYV